ncbi:MAG: DUF2914 domain-containing protein [Acidiferrobacterales bacterium]
MKSAYLATLGLATLGLVVALPLYAAESAAAPASEPAAPATAPVAMPSTAPETAKPAAEKPQGSVARAVFTSAVKNHEPVDTITTLTNDHTHIVFFTALKDMTGQTVTDRWEYKGKVMAEVKFNVGGPRWRVFSSKTLDPSWLGEWKVSVIDGNGLTLSASTFTYTAAPKESAAPASQPAPAPAPGTNPDSGGTAPAAPPATE